jgi:hypothetical protein
MKARNMEIEYNNNISGTLKLYGLQGKIYLLLYRRVFIYAGRKKISTINTKSGKKMSMFVGDGEF